MELEHKVQIIAVVVLVILFISVGSVFFGGSINPTGFVVLNEQKEVQQLIQSATRNGLFTKFGSDTNLCIIVLYDDKSYSFNVDKKGSFFEVQPTDNFMCDGAENEDLIIKFNSIENLEKYDTLSCDFKSGRAGADYYILPSKFVEESSGRVTCDEEFEKKFCPIIQSCLSDRELSAAAMLGCCDGFQEKEGKEESPGFFSGTLVNILLWSLIPIIIIIIIMVGYIVMKSHSEEDDDGLGTYIKNCREQGYQDFQIRNVLLSSGWDQRSIDQALQNSAPQSFTPEGRFREVYQDAPQVNTFPQNNVGAKGYPQVSSPTSSRSPYPTRPGVQGTTSFPRQNTYHQFRRY